MGLDGHLSQRLRRTAALLLTLAPLHACSDSADPGSASVVPSTSTPVTLPQIAEPTATTRATKTTPPATDADATYPPATVTGEADSDEAAPPRGLPDVVDGYSPSTDVQSETIRVFTDRGISSPFGLTATAGHCEQNYWALRFRTLSGDPIVIARAALIGDDGEPISEHPYVTSGSRGYVTGYGCQRPVFAALSEGGQSNTLFDVLVEYRYYGPTVDGPTQPAPSSDDQPIVAPDVHRLPDPLIGCDDYIETYNLMPFRLCDSNVAIAILQDALTQKGYQVDSDSRFGPGTLQAVRQLQLDHGIIPDGQVGATTWVAALTDALVDFGTDSNGDGIILPDEIPPGE